MSANHPTTLLLVGYARCSSHQQEASVPEQMEWIGTQVERGNHTLAAPIFSDEAIPGRELEAREGFQKMLAFCEEAHKAGNTVDGVMIFLLSRFSRAEAWWTNDCWNRLRRAGVRWLITSTRAYDLKSRTDHILLTIEQGGEADFSPKLALQVTRGLASKAQATGKDAGPVARRPYGYMTIYRQAGRAGKLTPARWDIDPDQGPVVRRIFRMYASGKESLRSIADAFNREGIPCRARSKPPANSRRKKVPKGWSATSIRDIIQNDVYLGAHIWNRRSTGVFACAVDGVPVERPDEDKGRSVLNDPSQVMRREDAHEPLVDRETFDRCQERLALEKQHPTPCRSKRVYLFSGLLRCGDCGATMAGRASRGLPPSYWCSTYNNKGRAACPPNRVSEARLLAALAAKLKDRFNPAFLDAFTEALRQELTQKDTAHGATLTDLQARLATLNEQVKADGERLLRIDPRLLAGAQAAALATIEQRDAVALELRKLEAMPQQEGPDPDEMIAKAREALTRLEEILAGQDRAEVRAFFRDNIDHIDLYFEPPAEKGSRRERFARALVFIRDDSPLVYLLYGEQSFSHPSVTNRKSYAAGYPTKTGLPGSDLSHATYSGMTSAGSRGFSRQAAHASGCVCHQAIVFSSPFAPGRVARLADKVAICLPSAVKAADAKLSMECGPGIGPSASMSVLT